MAVRGQRGSADGGRASGLPGGPGREAEKCQLPTWDGPATSYLRHSFSVRRSRQGRRQRGSLLSWKHVKEITTVSQTIYEHRAHRKRTKRPLRATRCPASVIYSKKCKFRPWQNGLVDAQTVKRRITAWPSNFSPTYTPKRIKSWGLSRSIYTPYWSQKPKGGNNASVPQLMMERGPYTGLFGHGKE